MKKKAPATGSKNTDPLQSQQWISESTVVSKAAAAIGSTSPSATDTGTDPELPVICQGKKPKPSDPMEKLDLHKAATPQEVGGSSTMIAGTDWKLYPTFDTVIQCDADARVWRYRATNAKFQIHFFIGQTVKPITEEAIANASCILLNSMLADLDALADTPAPVEDQATGWVPAEILMMHEMVHARLFSESAFRRYNMYVTAIEAITAPCSQTQDEATAAMSSALQTAQSNFVAGIKSDRDLQYLHEPAGTFIAAHIAATQQWIKLVLNKADELNCDYGDD